MVTGHLPSEDKTLISHAYLSFKDLLNNQHDLPSHSRVLMISLKAYGTLPPFKSAKYFVDSIPTIRACRVRTKERGEGDKCGNSNQAAPGKPGSALSSLGQGMKGPGQKLQGTRIPESPHCSPPSPRPGYCGFLVDPS